MNQKVERSRWSCDLPSNGCPRISICWTTSWLGNWGLGKIIFSDEKSFSSTDHGKLHCWRPYNTRYNQSNIHKEARSGQVTANMWGVDKLQWSRRAGRDKRKIQLSAIHWNFRSNATHSYMLFNSTPREYYFHACKLLKLYIMFKTCLILYFWKEANCLFNFKLLVNFYLEP